MHIGQAFTSDEAIPILDLKQSSPLQDTDALQRLEGSYDPRRISGSSFTMSTSGGMSDMPSYEEFSAALSEVPSFGSEYPPPSNRTSLLSSTQLSPMPSPRLGAPSRYDFVRAQSRGRGASPSPRPSIRTAPYSVESSRNNKRWSTGSYGTQHGRQGSPFRCHGHGGQDGLVTSQRAFHTYVPGFAPATDGHAAIHGSYWLTSQPPLQNGGMLLPPQGPPRISSMLPHEPPTLPSQPLNPDVPQRLDTSSSLLSRDLFKILQRNSNLGTLHGHYANLSDPPNLFASLHEEQVPPPPEDMEPEDPVMTPHEQELRFPGDLYTPHWVRGHGNKREGWCGICKPGRWLVLKNSAFWYDKSFSHGISAGTGSPFQEPQDTRRMEGNPDVWEGLCGGCSDWIALVSSKKKGTTWFRHAYKVNTAAVAFCLLVDPALTPLCSVTPITRPRTARSVAVRACKPSRWPLRRCRSPNAW